MPEHNGAASFERDIRPMFRDVDVEHMEPMDVLLDDYTWMSDPDNAQNVYDFLSGDKEPQMPPGGPFWSQEQLSKFSEWMKGGYQP